MVAAATVVAVMAVLGGALPAGAEVQPDGAGSGLGGHSGAAGSWATAPEGAELGAPGMGAESVPAPAPAVQDAATGSITGGVTFDETDEPAYGVTVDIARLVPETGAFTPVASADGPSFAFTGLEPGQYRLHFVAQPSQDARSEYWDDQLYESEADLITIVAGQPAVEVNAGLDRWGVYTYRYGGATRYDVAALISTLAFAPGLPVVYIANGERFPDALSAGPAAAHQKGALLLVTSTSVPDATVKALGALKPQKIVVVGGEAAISAGVYTQLAKLQPNIARIGGADRYEVSRNVIDYAFCGQAEGDCADGAATIFAATGANFPDALSAGPAVAHLGGAVLLVPGQDDQIDEPTALLLKRLGTDRVWVAGGPNSVTESLMMDFLSAMPAGSGVSRVSGADRFETSAAINTAVFGTGETALLATGAGFADALAGGPVAATIDAPLFLVQRDCYPEPIWNAIRSYDTIDLLLLGGENALSDSIYKVEYLCG
jgi:putative cell wall-binding protein